MTTTPKITEYENFIDFNDQERLIQYFCHPKFRWALSMDAVKGVDNLIHMSDDSIAGMFHTLVYDAQVCSEDFYSLSWILKYFDKIGIDTGKLFRMRVGMFFKHPSNLPHEPHVDAKVPHKTAVYYVNDCDGDFYLYQETYDSYLFRKPDQYQIIEKTNPKQGKLIIFDGKHFHASSYPNRSCLRLAITFNFYD